MATQTLELHPFTTPNFVTAIMPAGKKEDGLKGGTKFKLSDLAPETLAVLCDDFRREIFEKSGHKDPNMAPLPPAVPNADKKR